MGCWVANSVHTSVLLLGWKSYLTEVDVRRHCFPRHWRNLVFDGGSLTLQPEVSSGLVDIHEIGPPQPKFLCAVKHLRSPPLSGLCRFWTMCRGL